MDYSALNPSQNSKQLLKLKIDDFQKEFKIVQEKIDRSPKGKVKRY